MLSHKITICMFVLFSKQFGDIIYYNELLIVVLLLYCFQMWNIILKSTRNEGILKVKLTTTFRYICDSH